MQTVVYNDMNIFARSW